MKLFALLLVGTLLYSCSSTENIIKEELSDTVEQTEDITIESTKPERNIKLTAEIGEFKDSDLFEIQSAKIVENTLLMVVTFSGGCAEHKFNFVGSPMIMKSLPAKRSVKLIHDKNDDSCRSLVTKTLEIDLKNIAYNQTTGSEIVLLLEGWKGELKYTFI
tara:strand:- start:291 stop:773 length:483 start_codon:yes stop_codon:yes gene_type:complete